MAQPRAAEARAGVRGAPGLSRILIVVAIGLVASGVLLALAGATDSSGLAVAGTLAIVGALVAYEVLRWRRYDPLLKAITVAAFGLVALVVLGSLLID